MAVGFQAFNDNGIVQIDGENPTMALVRKVETTFSRGTGLNVAGISKDPEEFVAFSSTFAAVPYGAIGGNINFLVSAPWQADGAPITFYVFKHGIPSSTEGVGLQVLSSIGQVIYDSSWKLFNVRAVLSSNGAQQVTLPSGRTYAAFYTRCLVNRTASYPLFPITHWQDHAKGLSITGNQMSWSQWISPTTVLPQGRVGTTPLSECLILDVTGY